MQMSKYEFLNLINMSLKSISKLLPLKISFEFYSKTTANFFLIWKKRCDFKVNGRFRLLRIFRNGVQTIQNTFITIGIIHALDKRNRKKVCGNLSRQSKSNSQTSEEWCSFKNEVSTDPVCRVLKEKKKERAYRGKKNIINQTSE